MTTRMAPTSDDRLTAFIAMFEQLPEPVRQLLETQAIVLKEHEDKACGDGDAAA